jgi:hypothetical protein
MRLDGCLPRDASVVGLRIGQQAAAEVVRAGEQVVAPEQTGERQQATIVPPLPVMRSNSASGSRSTSSAPAPVTASSSPSSARARACASAIPTRPAFSPGREG